MESIPLFTTVLGSEEINSVIETMKSGNIGTGNKTELFEIIYILGHVMGHTL